jgi:hypothetical protein
MKVRWWEASGLFALWVIQFGFSQVKPGPGLLGFIAGRMHLWVTIAYFIWAGVEIVRTVAGRREAKAFRLFVQMWRRHVWR